MRRRVGGWPLVRAITDLPPVGRTIAVSTHARLVRPALGYAARELSGDRRAHRYVLRCGDRVVFLRHNTTDASILEEIFAARIYQPPQPVQAALRGLGRPLRIADLGANVGLFGLFAFERWQCERLTAFEPHPENAALQRRTIAANRLQDRWRLIEACAFTADGKLPFARDHHSDSRMTADTLASENGDPAHDTPAPDDPAHSPDGRELVAAVDALPLLADADLLKIDIEGGEWALLADPRFAELPATAIAVEYHPHLAPGHDARAHARRELERNGFTALEVFHDPRGHGMLWAWRATGPTR